MQDPIATTLETLDRLGDQLDLVERGSTTVRDDLAVVLNLLVGEGTGYGLVKVLCAHLGSAEPEIPVWGDSLPDSIAGLSKGRPMSLVLGIRSSPTASPNSTAAISTAVTETVLRWRHPSIKPNADWSLQTLAKKVRNQFGGHLDHKPPRWLSELRYYPAAGADV